MVGRAINELRHLYPPEVLNPPRRYRKVRDGNYPLRTEETVGGQQDFGESRRFSVFIFARIWHAGFRVYP